jgi:hypothetical protein
VPWGSAHWSGCWPDGDLLDSLNAWPESGRRRLEEANLATNQSAAAQDGRADGARPRRRTLQGGGAHRRAGTGDDALMLKRSSDALEQGRFDARPGSKERRAERGMTDVGTHRGWGRRGRNQPRSSPERGKMTAQLILRERL